MLTGSRTKRSSRDAAGAHELRIVDPVGGAQTSPIPAAASVVIVFKDADTDSIEALIIELDSELKRG